MIHRRPNESDEAWSVRLWSVVEGHSVPYQEYGGTGNYANDVLHGSMVVTQAMGDKLCNGACYWAKDATTHTGLCDCASSAPTACFPSSS